MEKKEKDRSCFTRDVNKSIIMQKVKKQPYSWLHILLHNRNAYKQIQL